MGCEAYYLLVARSAYWRSQALDTPPPRRETKHKQMYKTAARTILITLVLGMAASFLAPTPKGNDWFAFHTLYAVSLGTAIGLGGAAILFLFGLGVFTDRLKHAYRLICFAFVMLGIGFFQMPLILYIVDFSSFWKNNVSTALFNLVAIVMVYVGTRSLAKLFGVKGLAANPWAQLVGAILFSVLVILIPHVPTSTPDAKLNASLGATAFSVYNMGMAGVLIYLTKRVASVMYTKALAWMTVSLGVIALGGLLNIVAAKAFGDQQWYLVGAFPFVPLFIGALCMVRAAYCFNSIATTANDTHGWVARNFFGDPVQPPSKALPTSIDIVMYAATLVSNPRLIDPILDKFRQITARRKPGVEIPAEDEAELREIYLQIEGYLLSKEPIRKFTKETLRQSIAQRLRLTNSVQTTFWGDLI